MSARRLPPRVTLLDARDVPGAEGYLADSCWIPISELGERQHELPPPQSLLQVPLSQPDTVRFLSEIGRACELIGIEPTLESPPRTRLWHENPLLNRAKGKGRAIDLGCGSGRDALAISGMGYTVQAIDWLASALQKARELEWRTYGDNLIEWREMDLRAEFPEGQFDLISMFSFFKPDLLETARERLNPGGKILVEMFTREHQMARGKPKHVTSESELKSAFSDYKCLQLESGWRGDRHTVRGVWKKEVQGVDSAISKARPTT